MWAFGVSTISNTNKQTLSVRLFKDDCVIVWQTLGVIQYLLIHFSRNGNLHRHLVWQMTFCHLRTRSCVPIDKLTININRKYRHEIWVLLVPYVSIIKSVKQTFMRHENENKWIWYWSYPYIHISLYYHHNQAHWIVTVLTEF